MALSATLPTRGKPSRAALLVLAGLMVLAVVLVLATGGGIVYAGFDWAVVVTRADGGVKSVLDGIDLQLAFVPLVLIRYAVRVFGIEDAAVVLRVLVALAHALVGGLVFALARRRVASDWVAVAGAGLVLFAGAAWETLLSPVRAGDVYAVLFALAALLVAEDVRRSPVLVSALLCASVASSRFGLAATVLVLVLLLAEGRRELLWVAAAPVVVEIVWIGAFGSLPVQRDNVPELLSWSLDAAANAAAGVVGLTADWGRTLLLGFGAGVVFGVRRAGALTPRLAALLAGAAAWWVLTELARDPSAPADASRYAYGAIVLLVLAGVELLRAVELPTRAWQLAAAIALALVLLTGTDRLRDGSRDLEADSDAAKVELSAVQLAGAALPAGTSIEADVLGNLSAGQWIAAVARQGGSPATAPGALLPTPGAPGRRADAILRESKSIVLAGPRAASDGPGPVVDGGVGIVERHGACVRLSANATHTLTVPAAGLVVLPSTQPASVGVWRIADGPAPFAVVRPGAPRTLAVRPDAAPIGWRAQLRSAATVDACVSA